jgi:hypothetical protein
MHPTGSPYLFIKRLDGILTEGNRAVSRLMREEDQVTIWLSVVSLMAGAFLAQRFKIIVLAPATFMIVIVTAAIGVRLGTGLRPMAFTVAIASLGIQIGYFFGIFFQYRLASLWGLRTSRFSEKRRTQNPSIYRTPVL